MPHVEICSDINQVIFITQKQEKDNVENALFNLHLIIYNHNLSSFPFPKAQGQRILQLKLDFLVHSKHALIRR